MRAIFEKEIKSYFNSMSGYLFVGFFLAIIGLYHFVYNFNYAIADYTYVVKSVPLFFIFLIPILSMRIMAEENKQKTDQLLFTSPVSITGVIVGKYLAMVSLLAIVIAAACVQPAFLSKYSNVDLGAAYLSLFGLFLMGAAYLAIGLFVSSVTESQILAAVITFVIILFTNLSESIAAFFETDAFTACVVFGVIMVIITVITYITMRNILISAAVFAVSEVTLVLIYLLKPTILENSIVGVFSWFSVMFRLDSFVSGIVSLSDIVYYLSVIGIFVFLTVQSVSKRRWN